VPDGERWAQPDVKRTEPEPETVIRLHFAAEKIHAAHQRGGRCPSCRDDHCIEDLWATSVIYSAYLSPVGPLV
jgi:hypothetical protein